MTLTLPKGAKDIKNSMILGNATTYQVIISRVIGATLKPFTVQDYYYGKKQAGSTNYYDYQLYTISSQVDTNGVSTLNQIMSNLICLEISRLLKSTRVWATCDRQDPDLDLHLQISQKRKQYLRTWIRIWPSFQRKLKRTCCWYWLHQARLKLSKMLKHNRLTVNVMKG